MTKQKTILIVDDVPENIKTLASVLRDEYRLIFATNGQDALQMAADDPQPDMILLDILMPEMDGFEVCRLLKADERTRAIPVIFVTALSKDQDKTKGLELGAVDYVIKPFVPDFVKASVRTHMKFKDANDYL